MQIESNAWKTAVQKVGKMYKSVMRNNLCKSGQGLLLVVIPRHCFSAGNINYCMNLLIGTVLRFITSCGEDRPKSSTHNS